MNSPSLRVRYEMERGDMRATAMILQAASDKVKGQLKARPLGYILVSV